MHRLGTRKPELFVMLQAARHHLGLTQAPAVAQSQAAWMAARAVAATPAAAIVKKMSQHLVFAAPREHHQTILTALDIMLSGHNGTSVIQADQDTMPQEVVWSGTVSVITKINTAGMMTMIGVVMIGNLPEAVVTGNTPDLVMDEKTTGQSPLLTPQPDALLARLVFPAITGHRFKRVSSRAESCV